MIRFVLCRALSALFLCAVIACGGDDGKESGSGDQPAEDAAASAENLADAAPAAPGPVEYDDTEAGLTKLFDDLIVSLRSKDGDKDAARLVQSLILPHHDKWLETHFKGRRTLKRLKKDLGKVNGDIGSLGLALRGAAETGKTTISVKKFAKETPDGAVGFQLEALEKALEPIELYSVRLADSANKVLHVYSFVHADGTFRFVGKLWGLVPPKKRTKSPSKREILDFTPQDQARILAAESPPDAGPR